MINLKYCCGTMSVSTETVNVYSSISNQVDKDREIAINPNTDVYFYTYVLIKKIYYMSYFQKLLIF